MLNDDMASRTEWDPETLERRRKGNVLLGLAFGALAVTVFLLALWKVRPF